MSEPSGDFGHELPLNAASRNRLAEIADQLIPETDGMPAASSVGVADRQLEVVMRSRADLLEPLQRVLDVSFSGSAMEFLESVAATDPQGHEALVLTILGGYYSSEQVVRLLGYPGQSATVVSLDTYPPYVAEDLLAAVVERGPIFRPTPDEPSPGAAGTLPL
jgi:hypothetical protein